MRPRIRRRPMAEINVVPYIDVMLVLLVIFMVTAPLLSQGVKVELPKAPSAPIYGDGNGGAGNREFVIINVDAGGNFYINYGDNQDQPVPAATLINRLSALMRYQPGTPVVIAGDARVPYERIIKLTSMLQRSGISGVGLLTDPPDNN